MIEQHRRALAAVRLEWARTPEDVWQPSPDHVAGIHRGGMELLLAGVEDARMSGGASPIGAVIVGESGSGKTHLLGALRQEVQRGGGYFFLVSLLDAAAFWRSVLLSVADGLTRPGEDGATQLDRLLGRLADAVEAPRTIRRAVAGESSLTRAALDAFVDLLRKRDAQLAQDCQDTARALALRGSDSATAVDIGHTYLTGNDEEEPGERAQWGIRRAKRSEQEIVRDLSRLLALTGPSVIAVDQIDRIVAQAGARLGVHTEASLDNNLVLEQIAGGLMALRETTRRTLSVLSCLPNSWQLVYNNSTGSINQRFRETTTVGVIGSAEHARELIERRLAPAYARAGFTPPHPTWPVHPSAFTDAVDFTPRGLLVAVDQHIRDCLERGEVTELRRLVFGERVPVKPSRPEPEAPESSLSTLDARYAELLAVADPAPALDPATEDEVVPGLLGAGLVSWIAERGRLGLYTVDPPPGSRPALHARLVRRGEGGEDDAHWAFRAVVASNAIAALNRIRNAMTVAGLSEGAPSRQLFLLRTDPWPNGQRTAETVAAFEAAGGQTLDFPLDDIGVLVALRDLELETDPETFAAWCASRRPTRGVSVLGAALSYLDNDDDEGDDRADRSEPASVPSRPSAASAVPLGTDDRSQPVAVELMELRKHVAIFAGSGSGKTVFLRRLIEECALHGVSSIVLDLNNDLARLGDSWPDAPSSWSTDDQEKAKSYLDQTEVVVWTPGRDAGRPLSFPALPDFSAALDPDEFRSAVDAAVAALAPRAGLPARAVRSQIGQAVLREALTHFAKGGGSNLREFIALLNDLPDGVSLLADARRMAAGMAQALTAATVNDPLWGGEDEPADPGRLLTPSPGYAARVSVISFVGLPAEEQQQSFINRLQLSLFSWIKHHPAPDGALSGLLVMDEAQNIAPSRGVTACVQSTLALVSQARKYGLGLVFATQAPKGLHNGIPGNSATQLFGRLGAPAHITAARDIARAKGGDVPDIARLGSGEFYAAVAGGSFARIRTPMCLSEHPASALTVEEVLDRSRRSAA
jgi:hypothetical protein